MDFWEKFKEHTHARIGLHRVGHSLSTKELLIFQTAHALARDAVNETWNTVNFERKLKKIGEKPLILRSAVSIREQYLKYPTLGRKLCKASHEKLEKYRKKHRVDFAFIITDGLSTSAIESHFISFWKVFKAMFTDEFPEEKIALIIVPFGRVALGDEIGKTLGVKESIIFVGERPGLSSVDSLGIYLTYSPKLKNSDANRNCISNIHPPEGLSYEIAADKLLYLIRESLHLKLSGVHLKEELVDIIHSIPELL